MLTERVAHEDRTCISYGYSDQNLRIAEVSREGARTAWEYDIYGRLMREAKPDGFETHYEYDETHNLVRVWDTDDRETVNRYDEEHNPCRWSK